MVAPGLLLPPLLLLLLSLVLRLEASGAEETPPRGCRPSEPEQPFDALYAAGGEAHSRGDFAGAVSCWERALSAERRLRETRLACGLSCRRETPLAAEEEEGSARALHDLAVGAALLRRARCLRSCRRGAGLGADSRHVASEEVRADFQRRVPYSYLQRAYLQVRRRPPGAPGERASLRVASPVSSPEGRASCAIPRLNRWRLCIA